MVEIEFALDCLRKTRERHRWRAMAFGGVSSRFGPADVSLERRFAGVRK
jgi:hypothetical protein